MSRTVPALPAVIGGKYRPVRLIARGGMGAVYEVVHANTGQRLALKLMLARSLLAPDLVERFRREARIHGSVKSEHVVRVVDADVAGELDDAPFLVMELLEGHDFERLCLEQSPTTTQALDWLRQLASALDKAHGEGIVHRDLKPENLFLADREGLPPIVKILDFGIAKIEGERTGHATATGQILGTPRYMAPEQAVGSKEVTAAADRFALGLIAFRLLTWRHYFEGDNWVALLREVARGPQTRPSAMGVHRGAAFDTWFARACAFRPEDRFPTAAAQIEALAGALAATGRRRWPRWRVGVVLGAVGGLPLGAWALASRHHPSPPQTLTRATPVAAAPTVEYGPLPATLMSPMSEDAPGPPSGLPRRLRRHGASVSASGVSPAAKAPARDGVWDEP